MRQALARNLGSFHLCKSSFPLHSGLFILKSRWREEKGERQGRRKTEIDSDSAHSPWGVFGSEVSMKAIFFFFAVGAQQAWAWKHGIQCQAHRALRLKVGTGVDSSSCPPSF